MEGFRRSLLLVDTVLIKIAKAIVLISSVVLIFSISVQVSFRYIFNNSPRWTTELCTFMLVFLVFWGATIALRQGLHVSLDVEKFKMPKQLHFIFKLISSIAVYVFLVVVFYYGFQITLENIDSLSEAMKIPYALIYVNLPLTSLFMMYGYSVKILVKNKAGDN